MLVTESPPSSSAGSVDALITAVAERLRDACTTLPEGACRALAEEVVLDALRLALDWVEPTTAAPARP